MSKKSSRQPKKADSRPSQIAQGTGQAQPKKVEARPAQVTQGAAGQPQSKKVEARPAQVTQGAGQAQMSIKQARYDRRREEQQRRAAEVARAARTRRMAVRSLIGIAVLVLAFGGFLLWRNLSTSSASATATRPVYDPAYPPVGNLYCEASEQVAVHYHAHLSIYINNQLVEIPANVGISSSCLYWNHTHDTTGVIHIEAPVDQKYILNDFFGVWGKEFAGLGKGYPAQLDLTSGWTVYVDGKPYTGDFHKIVLGNHQLITLAYNSPDAKPDTTYNWNGL